MDSILSEKQQRLLTEPLYSAWTGPGEGRPFLAAANVGVFYLARNPAIVPDVFFSADVEVPQDFSRKENRSYFLWEFGKPPDIAIEIVSNKEGGEDGEKKQKYVRMRISYYVIYDPLHQIMPGLLTVYRLQGYAYERVPLAEFPEFNLGLTLWQGEFEESVGEWLRWTDKQGKLVLTGKELAEREHWRAEQERQRAEQERQRADLASQEQTRLQQQLELERQRVTQLEERLRQLEDSAKQT